MLLPNATPLFVLRVKTSETSERNKYKVRNLILGTCKVKLHLQSLFNPIMFIITLINLPLIFFHITFYLFL